MEGADFQSASDLKDKISNYSVLDFCMNCVTQSRVPRRSFHDLAVWQLISMPESVIQHEEVCFVLLLRPSCRALSVLLVTTAKCRSDVVLPWAKSSVRI
jgi:hypothetical protein